MTNPKPSSPEYCVLIVNPSDKHRAAKEIMHAPMTQKAKPTVYPCSVLTLS